MYTHILVPIDLSMKESLQHAIHVAADLARHYGARLTLVSVTGGIQPKVTHSTEHYEELLAEFAREIEAAEEGVKIGTRVYDVPDPSVQVDSVLVRAVDEIDADLVVIGSHRPGWVEYLIDSHGGRIASHAPVSVFVVREAD